MELKRFFAFLLVPLAWPTRSAITCSKLTIETLEQDVNNKVQSEQLYKTKQTHL